MNLSNKRDLTIFLSQLARKRRKDLSIYEQVRSILAKYNATMLLPGVSGVLRFGYQPGNYRESTGQTLAAADQQVGLVVDAARAPGVDLLNGTGSGISTAGWVAASATVASVAGEFAVTATTAAEGICVRNISVQAGKTYVLSGNVRQGTAGNGATLRIRRGPSGSFTTVATTTSNVNGQVVFTAPATETDAQVVMRCLANTVGQTAYFSDIQIREIPGIHASQSTSGFQPVLRNSGGIQSWQFDGTDDRLSLSAVPFQMSDDHFVVLGLSSNDVYAERRPFFVRNGATMFGITFGGSGQNTLAANWIDDAGLNCSVSSANAVHNNTNYAVSMRKSGNSKTLRRDGVQLGLNTVQLGTATLGAALPFIGMENGVSRPFIGPIHGLIFGEGAITDAELLTLERFVASLQGRTL